MIRFLEEQQQVLAFMSDKTDGPLGRISEEKFKRLPQARLKFIKSQLKRKKIKPEKIIAAEIAHGRRVGLIEEASIKGTSKNQEIIYPGVDGLVTNIPNVFLSVTIADCVAVYFFAAKAAKAKKCVQGRDQKCKQKQNQNQAEKPVIGICHAGWRGIVAGVVPEVLAKMECLGVAPKEIHCALSPAIGKDHFETGPEVAECFLSLGFKKEVKKNQTKYLIDLRSAIKTQLTSLGVLKGNIFIHPDCTFCNPEKYYSFRYRKGKAGSVMLAGIILK